MVFVSALGTTDHVPLRVSTSVCGAPLLEAPTAVHELIETHETPLRVSSPNELTFGLGTTDQMVPSQDSINVLDRSVLGVLYSPTAVHELVEIHETPLSSLIGGEVVLGSGLGTTVQVVPSHISTRVPA
jgi:hypothetical protein